MIDARAEIHPSAQLADDVVVGPWTRIGAHVSIDAGTRVDSNVVIEGPTKIGQNNHIFSFASVGGDPQDKKYQGEETYLEMGDNNVIREFTTINRGTLQGGGVTRIGHRTLIMAYAHVAHDCLIGNDVILANYVGLAGHVIIEDWAILAGYAGVHQFCTIGAHAFVGNNCKLTKDVLPYLMVAGGDQPKPYGLNTEGLKRRGFDEETLSTLKKAYRIIFRQDLNTDDALRELEPLSALCPPVEAFIAGLKKATRGFLK